MPSTLSEGTLFNQDPTAYLPHRHPFLFLDRILTREAGISATAIKRVSRDDGGFPQVLLVEAMAQLAGVAAADKEGEGGFLAAIDHAEFSGEIPAGETLLVSVRIVKSFGRLHLAEGSVTAGDSIIATATLTLGVGPLQAISP